MYLARLRSPRLVTLSLARYCIMDQRMVHGWWEQQIIMRDAGARHATRLPLQ